MASVELDLERARVGDLPRLCIYCGAPATSLRNKTFHGTRPHSVFWTPFRPRVAMPVCDRHRGASLRKSLLLPVLLPFLAVLALFANLSEKRGPPPAAIAFLLPFKPVLVVAVCVLFVALIVMIRWVWYGDIHCTRLTRSTVTLAGVAEAFDEAYRRRDEEPVAEVLPVDRGEEPATPVRPPTPVRTAAPQPGPPRVSAVGWFGRVLGLVLLVPLLACGGCLLLVLFPLLGTSPPVVLSNPRTVRGGPVDSAQVDYRFRQGSPGPAARYAFVVRSTDGATRESTYTGDELQDAGSLRIELPPRGLTMTGPLEIFLEVETGPPGAPRRRVSNVLRVP